MLCPHCSATIEEGHFVCPSCGKPLVDSESEKESDSQQPQQPPVNLPVQRPYRKFILGMALATVALGGYAVVALALGAKFSDVPVILSLSFSMAFLIAIAIFAWVGSIEFRVMRRMVAREYLVRWTYTQKEWERFTEQSWEKSWKIHVWVLVALLLFALILALIVSQISATLMFVGIAVGYGLLLFGGDYWLYRQRRKQGAGEVLISRVGILRPEGFTLLLGLDTVKLEPGPQAIIQFTCQYRTTSRDGISNTSQKTFEVPVPHGQEAEAKRLVQQFQST